MVKVPGWDWHGVTFDFFNGKNSTWDRAVLNNSLLLFQLSSFPASSFQHQFSFQHLVSQSCLFPGFSFIKVPSSTCTTEPLRSSFYSFWARFSGVFVFSFHHKPFRHFSQVHCHVPCKKTKKKNSKSESIDRFKFKVYQI